MTLDDEAGRVETAFEEEADDDDTTVGCATLVLLTDPGAGTLPLPGQFWPCLYTKPACVRPMARRQTVHWPNCFPDGVRRTLASSTWWLDWCVDFVAAVPVISTTPVAPVDAAGLSLSAGAVARFRTKPSDAATALVDMTVA